MGDDDRPKRSWRDIDRGKDKSAHRSEEPRGSGRRKERERATKTYRVALDKLFEQGGVGKLLGEDVSTGTEGSNRFKAIAAIRKADDPDDITKAIDSFSKEFGDLPEDIEVWARAVFHRDEDIQGDAITKISALLEVQKLKRVRALVGRLRYIEELGETKSLQEGAAALRKKLG